MIDLKYRIDFVRLENESMPDSANINDGSTCYIIDTGELYIYYKGTWYNSDVESVQSENGQSENQQSENQRNKNQPIENQPIENTKDSIIENDEKVIKTDETTKDEEVIEDDK